MKVTLLGTGSPEAHVSRASSGYLVEAGDDTLLLDCGGGIFDRLLQSGRTPGDVTHLVFSHLHSDHMMDYARLVHARWDSGADNLDVWGPEPLAEVTGRYFGPDGALSFDLVARTELPQSKKVWQARGGALPRPWPKPRVTEMHPPFLINGNGWTMRAIEVLHAQPYLACLGFRIESGGKSVVYAGDSGHSAELETLIKGADLLIHWCYRLSHEPGPDPAFEATTPGHLETARLAERAGVKHLVLTHWRVQHDREEILSRVREEVAECYSGRFSIARDLAEIVP